MNSKLIAFFAIFAVLIGTALCNSQEDDSSIKLHFYTGSSIWWIAVDPRNDRYDTVKVEIREASESEWTTLMHFQGWDYFHTSSTSGRGFALPLSFRLTSATGEQVITAAYRISSNFLFDTKTQYGSSSTTAPTEPATEAPTQAPTQPATEAPTVAPTQPATEAPTQAPTQPATEAPTQPATEAPTQAPTEPATEAPTQPATEAPTQAPTEPATEAPTQAPTEPATEAPTQAPTQPATQAPTVAPTTRPTTAPTTRPTTAPTTRPTTAPTTRPTQAPTPKATDAPTRPPTAAPTPKATDAPTAAPTPKATAAPTPKATAAPTPKATAAPTPKATAAPTPKATAAPTPKATAAPTPKATVAPTQAPTPKATVAPTQAPTQPASGDVCSLVATQAEPMKILVPLYVYPGAAWDNLITAANNGAKIIAIINPNSGPAASGPDSSYLTYMRKFTAAGIEMVGYVHTIWGDRSISTVNTEIGIYASKYPGVTGIFFDEASAETSDLEYYGQAYRTVLSKGFKHSILNPGTQPVKGYLDISTNIVIFENYASELSRAKYDSWVKCAPSNSQKSGYKYKFSAIIHTASQSDVSSLIQKTHDLGMGLVYITDGPGGCCTYNYLANYFTAEATAVKALNSR